MVKGGVTCGHGLVGDAEHSVLTTSPMALGRCFYDPGSIPGGMNRPSAAVQPPSTKRSEPVT